MHCERVNRGRQNLVLTSTRKISKRITLVGIFLLQIMGSIGWTWQTSAWAQTWPVTIWEQPFDYTSTLVDYEYTPAHPASKSWRLCVSYPHMKDAYWFSVNYGMVEEAKRLGVSMEVLEAGGYPNLKRQIEQIGDCLDKRADALIVGAVSYEGLTEEVLRIANDIPVLGTVNDITDLGISAKSGVSWIEMGAVVGRYLKQKHPVSSEPGDKSSSAKVAWFPGPRGAGWVKFISDGFISAIQDSDVEIVVTKWGDTGKEIQRTLLQEALESHPDIDYIVGNALVAEAAISELRGDISRKKIKVISTYFTHGVFRGIKRNRILAAPTDSPVIQGRISINQAVRILEGRPFIKHAGPKIFMIDQSNVNSFDVKASLAPSTFLPTFRVMGRDE